MIQYSTTHRSNVMTDIVGALGGTPYLLVYTGATPANCAAAPTGALLGALPCSNPFGTIASGVLTANAISIATALLAGIAGYWRLCTSAGGATVVAQGSVYGLTNVVTNANLVSGNVLVVESTAGVVQGMTVTGENIPPGTTVIAFDSSTITLSAEVQATIPSGTTIALGGDITFAAGAAFAFGQNIQVTSLVLTATGS